MPLPFIIAGLSAIGSAIGGAAAAATVSGAVVTAGTAVAGAAAAGAAVAVANKASKGSYHTGYVDASAEYKQKMDAQASEFTRQMEKLINEARCSIAKKEELLESCQQTIEYQEQKIEFLEERNLALETENRTLRELYNLKAALRAV